MILSLKHQNKSDKDKVLKEVKNKVKAQEKKKLKKELSEKEILRRQQLKIRELIEDWKDVMFQTGTYNQYFQTFTFDDIKYEKYGFKVKLYVVKGLTFKMLDSIRDKIEDGLNCIFIYNKERLDRYMEVRIVTQLSTDKMFYPPETKPWEIYIGDRFDGTPIIIDLNKWCQVLISGTTGGGKSKLLDCILTTQIHNHTPKDLWLFTIQLDKCDLLAYEDATITKGFADNLDKAVVMLEYIMQEIKIRNKLVAIVKKKFIGSNITDYNKYNPKNKQPTILVVLDEMASIAEKGSDNPVTKAKKQMIDDMLSAVAQYGRSNNVFLISCLQRATANLLNPFIKSMSNLKISFRQSNSKSSEVSMDDSTIALDLAQRVAVFKLLSYDFLQTPYIDDPLIEKYIKDKLQPNHITIFDSIESSQRLEELNNLGSKNNDKNKNNSKETTPPPQNSGREEVSYEQILKQKEQELKDYEEKIRRQEEHIKSMALKLKKYNEKSFKDTYDKLLPEINKTTEQILEENKKKNPNWVEYTPPPQTGKEIVE
jgi:hypothetical protein